MAWQKHPVARQLEVVLEHYEAMLSYYGVEAGLRIARKHLGWYTKGLPGSAEVRQVLNHLTDPKEVVRTLIEYYTPIATSDAA